MKRKLSLLIALLLTSLFVFSAVAQDYDDDYAPRRRRARGWKGYALTRTLSVNVGLWAALESKVEAPDGSSSTIKPEDPDYLFSIGAKLWFYRSNWGIGIDAVLLDTQKFEASENYSYWDESLGVWTTDTYSESYEMQKWMIDLDLYYRLPLTRNIQAIAGAGFTFIRNVSDSDVYTEDDTANVGYNLKAGGELFIDRNWSVSLMFTWHHFKDGGIVNPSVTDASENTMKMFSANAQLNFYL